MRRELFSPDHDTYREMVREFVALALTSLAFNTAVLAHLDETPALERAGQTTLFDTHDHAQGVAAFREKRTPHFSGA